VVDSMAAANAQQPEQPEQAAVRAEMQDWMTYPVFMRRTMWDTLFSEETQLKKMEMVLQAMVDLGLRHSSERTLCMVCSLIVHTAPEQQQLRRIEEDAVRAASMLSTVKSVAKRLATRAKQLQQPLVGGQYMVTLPGTVEELPWIVSQNLYHTIVHYPPPVDLNPIWRSANAWICRNTNARLRQQAPQLGGLDPHALAQQTAVVAGTMLALVNGGQRCEGLPGLQIFQGNPQQPRGPSALHLALERASEPAAPTRSLAAGQALPRVASAPLALEDGSPETIPSAVVAAAAVAPASAGTASDLPEAKQAAGAAQCQPEPAVDQGLARSLNALAQAHYDKELPDLPDRDVEMDSGLQKGMKRPAAAVLRKPACAEAKILKRPAAIASTGTASGKMKRPASAAGPAKQEKGLAKPAGKKSRAGKTQEAAAMQPITRKLAAKKFPHGCSRCRGTVGCTPSCWKKRNYNLID